MVVVVRGSGSNLIAIAMVALLVVAEGVVK